MIAETKSSMERGSDEKAWLKILAKYRKPHAGRSVFELTPFRRLLDADLARGSFRLRASMTGEDAFSASLP